MRVPKGFAPDHPRAELLKYKGLICTFPAIPAGILHKPELARWLLDGEVYIQEVIAH